ncbi:MAG: hypothetical protein WKG01_26615, partial [Kofleriaceae bacterium]
MRTLACLSLLAACGESSSATALFALPGDTTDFYSLPFPNDLRREADGTIDLSAFPTNSLIADKYRQAADSLDGFGLNGAVFARFDGTLDHPSLPDPAGSVAEGASVYLVNVDPDSLGRSSRVPILVRFRAEKTQTMLENHLIARPYPGFGLAEGTTYALVITKRVGGVKASPVFEALMGTGGDAKTIDARAVYEPLLAYLDEPGGDERDDVVSAAVFTTQRATQIVPALRKAVFDAPAPTASNVVAGTATPALTIFTGSYTAPNFQSGDVPYRDAPAGQIMVAGDSAVVQRMEAMRFGLSVPAGAVPANGFPIA